MYLRSLLSTTFNQFRYGPRTRSDASGLRPCQDAFTIAIQPQQRIFGPGDNISYWRSFPSISRRPHKPERLAYRSETEQHREAEELWHIGPSELLQYIGAGASEQGRSRADLNFNGNWCAVQAAAW
jgi:hypothetical protein